MVQNLVQAALSNDKDKAEARHTFHHLPNTVVSQQQHSSAPVSQEPGRFGADQMRAEPQGPRVMRMFSGSGSQGNIPSMAIVVNDGLWISSIAVIHNTGH